MTFENAERVVIVVPFFTERGAVGQNGGVEFLQLGRPICAGCGNQIHPRCVDIWVFEREVLLIPMRSDLVGAVQHPGGTTFGAGSNDKVFILQPRVH